MNGIISTARAALTRSVSVRPQVATAVSLVGAVILGIAMRAAWIGGFRYFPADATNAMLACGGLALLVSGIMMPVPPHWRRAGEWILVAIGVLVVVLASDLVSKIDNGSVSVKLIVLGMVATALRLNRLFIPAPTGSVEMQRQQAVSAFGLEAMAKFLCIAAQLGLLVILIGRFNLVSPVFSHQIVFLTFYGFVIHYFLPLEYRLPFFLFLSFSAIFFIFGFVEAAWLIGLGLGLIGLCHLPIRFSYRVVLLVLAGIALSELRVNWIQPPWSVAIWPILGSMFMFRLIAYMYSLKHRKAPVGLWPSLSYFFLLPNVVFPLFPVVDYTTFHRTYYDSERHLIHQTGLKWILRGIVHLLLYRCVYYYMVISPEEVNSVTNLVRYLVSNFLLILKLSGQFHLIVGMLLLFGFNLPETMNRYFLASSFTDFWRRANIYWRDFMQRVVFYPVYFPLRSRAPTAGLACATFVVFLSTWALHSYQWFWLRGSFSVSAPDILFWTLFGLLVVINTLYEAKHGRKREIGKHAQTWGDIASLGLRIAGTFCAICLLWSLWVSTSVSEWLSLWSVPGITWKDVSVLGPALIGAAVLALWAGATSRAERASSPGMPVRGGVQPSFFSSAALTASFILALFLVVQPIIYSQFGGTVRQVIADLGTDKLNEQDMTLLERGYYESLTRVNRFNSQLWELYNRRASATALAGPTKGQPREDMPAEVPGDEALLEDIRPSRPTRNFLLTEFRPSLATIVKGKPFHTNRWGMRDKDYEMKPPPGTCRIALLGGSPEVGSGVGDDEKWETLLEDRLNRENDRKKISQYEILNFSCGTYTSLQRLGSLEMKALSFAPDIVFFAAHNVDESRTSRHLLKVVQQRIEIPYDYLRQVVHEAGVEGETNEIAASRDLKPYNRAILTWTYHRVVELCRQRNIIPVYLLLPQPTDLGVRNIPNLVRMAKEAGFVVVDLSGLFDNKDKATLGVSEVDHHPNAIGHKLIADGLYKELKSNPALQQRFK
jgi:D-alanyl-lipoteichoic acid acyltransferase DltB (MBOAT superfamily)